MRVRGLKLLTGINESQLHSRTLRSVWIETREMVPAESEIEVALFGVRGLKLVRANEGVIIGVVARSRARRLKLTVLCLSCYSKNDII